MRPPPNRQPDEGSVKPLIIGMMLCLLILGAGVTAAGSAFLAGQRVQHLCDGAAATAGGSVSDHTTPDSLQTAAETYLALHSPDVSAGVLLEGTTLSLTCSADTPITFGALFGRPTLHRTVHATGRSRFTQN